MSLKGGLNGSSMCVCEAPCGSAIVFFNHFDFSGSIWPCFILTCLMKVCINSTLNKTKTHGIDTQKWALVCVCRFYLPYYLCTFSCIKAHV